MCLTALSNFAKTSSDFSGYISKVLRNYSDHACDGQYVSLRCPHRTTISIQSSFYGRTVPSHQMCPSRNLQSYAALIKEDVTCSVGTSLQKMLDECQDRRSCQFLVSSRLFGLDPCPGTGKYLIVWYKCRPKCQSTTALQIMTRRCHGKRRCSVYASTYEFGDPCYPGVHKHLNVIYTCVPRKLLHETELRPTNYPGIQQPHFPQQPRVYDPNVIGDGVFFSDVSPSILVHSLPEKKKGRSATFYPLDNTALQLPVDETQQPVDNSSMEPVGVSTEMALLSNILAAYSFITENPERAALYFVSGVCIGLVLTLLALVLKVSCRTDCKQSPGKKPPREPESDSDSSESDDDSDTTSDLSARRHRRFERTLNMNVFTSAEELERAQRLEERERIIREIWMNGQPDIPGTRSLNRYY
ncbi:protein eva-1 homolog A isoform X3 [Carettochelys insculpta]|uniref:protein eva-1 homolog A isoform X3 n=1 Tax=Carettochelys insculpta TaxID=44489 RepID=UPI003EB99718